MEQTITSPALFNSKPINMRQANLIRFGLPLFLFLLATLFEIWEHWIEGENLFIDRLGLMEIAVFGIIGPSIVYFVITYMLRLMQDLEEARRQTAGINQNLERMVADRTWALQQSNDELAQANSQLQELDRMKSDFVALVSHELRSPLATLNGGLEVARQSEASLPPKTRRIMQVLSLETQRLTQFVQTMLDVSLLEHGKLVMTCGPVAVRPLLDRAAEMVMGEEAGRLAQQLPADLPPILADEMYLEQSVRNLLRNALKYSPPHSPIGIDATVDGDMMRLCVTDYGPGVPKDEQGRVFERFYRSRNGNGHKPEGWGLGLYFAKALIEAQGGGLAIQSPVQDDPRAPGSRFIVSLPIAEEEPFDGDDIAD